MGDQEKQLTVLLREWREGKPQAREELMECVYPQLRLLAARYMSGESSGHTLNATGLVHEAYLKMLGADIAWQDRTHFFAVCARVMRRILVDHARTQQREKRGGSQPKLSLEEAIVISSTAEQRLLDLDEALQNLASFDPRKAEVIELVYFGGMTQSEAAEVLQVSQGTVERDLRLAKAWLYRALNDNGQNAATVAGFR